MAALLLTVHFPPGTEMFVNRFNLFHSAYVAQRGDAILATKQLLNFKTMPITLTVGGGTPIASVNVVFFRIIY